MPEHVVVIIVSVTVVTIGVDPVPDDMTDPVPHVDWIPVAINMWHLSYHVRF